MSRFPDPKLWTYEFDFLERKSDGCVIFAYDKEFVFLLKIRQFEDMDELLDSVRFLGGSSCEYCIFVARDDLMDRGFIL